MNDNNFQTLHMSPLFTLIPLKTDIIFEWPLTRLTFACYGKVLRVTCQTNDKQIFTNFRFSSVTSLNRTNVSRFCCFFSFTEKYFNAVHTFRDNVANSFWSIEGTVLAHLMKPQGAFLGAKISQFNEIRGLKKRLKLL